ncbi:hypothetical protein TNCV_278631 [Trichonephila clavipes]|nr:hypothetical protein TNCV_278631 [Trichonephila clavipes]
MSHPSNFKVFFTRFAVSNGALSCNIIPLLCLLAHSGHLSINAWSRRTSRVHNAQCSSGPTRYKVWSSCRNDLALVLKNRLRQVTFPLLRNKMSEKTDLRNIPQVYAEKTVLITGGNGFLGKVFEEMLSLEKIAIVSWRLGGKTYEVHQLSVGKQPLTRVNIRLLLNKFG